MLPLLVLSGVFQLGTPCQRIPLYYGTLDTSLIIPGGTITDAGSSCRCCALCNNDPRCKSFSFRRTGGECSMYSKVGGYPVFLRQNRGAENDEFYIMPGKSTTGEFCRSDEDCLSGEPCRANVCTTNETITCRTIKDLNPTTFDHTFWGAVGGTEMRLHCIMDLHGGGWTLVVNAVFNYAWQQGEVYSKGSVDGDEYLVVMRQSYSALWAADLIRDSMPGDYQVIVKSISPDAGALFTVPRAQSLVGDTPVSVPFTPEPSGTAFTFSTGSVVFPYMLNQNDIFYHMNSDATTTVGGIVRGSITSSSRWAAGALRPHTIQVWIKEGQ